jgi:hypothetical protein
MVQVVECVPGRSKAPNSIPSTANKTKQKTCYPQMYSNLMGKQKFLQIMVQLDKVTNIKAFYT